MAKKDSDKVPGPVLSNSERSSLVDSLNRHLGGSEPEPKLSEPALAGSDEKPEGVEPVPVARRLGRFLFFSTGPAPEPGQSVAVGGQHYEVMPAAWYWRLAPLLVLLAVPVMLTLLLIQAPAVEQHPLLGMVTDSESGRDVSGAAISIPELGISTTTDARGRFRIPYLAPESYLVRVNSPGYQPSFASVIIGDQAELLHLELMPFTIDSSEIDVEESEPQPEAQPQFGKIRVKSNLEKVEIALNSEPLGSGNSSFGKIKPGRHVIILSAPGFTDYVEEIKVKAGQTTEVVAILLPEPEVEAPELGLADYLQRGDSLAALDANLEAIGYYTLAIADDPESAPAYHKRAQANLNLDNRLAAIADFREAGTLFSKNGNYSRAIACFDEILDLSPAAVQIHQLRGWAKIWSGGIQGGLVDLEKALSFDDDNWQARFQLGKALCLTGDYDAAEKHLKKIRKHEEEQPQIDAFLALAYLGKEKNSDAVKYFRKYTELATADSDSQLKRLAGWNQLTTLAAEAGD